MANIGLKTNLVLSGEICDRPAEPVAFVVTWYDSEKKWTAGLIDRPEVVCVGGSLKEAMLDLVRSASFKPPLEGL